MPSGLVRIHLQLPGELIHRLDLSVWDPIRSKPTYGARTALIRRLIELHLEKLDAAKTLNQEQTL